MKIYEDALAEVLLPPQGAVSGHMQVFPKRKVMQLEELDADEAEHLMYVASYAATVLFETLGAHGSNILLVEGSGDIPLHYDVLARKQEDGYSLRWDPQKLSEQEMSQAQEKIKDAIGTVPVGVSSTSSSTSSLGNSSPGSPVSASQSSNALISSSSPASNSHDVVGSSASGRSLEDEEEYENYLIKQLHRVP